MKNFIKNSFLFFVVFISILTIGLLLPNRSHPRSIDYSIVKKHECLNSITEPKIILTGGSNVLFGFNSKIIEDSLKMPIVNHAIHAGYGLKYILDDLEPYINKGDIIILAPEYSHFFDNNRLGSEPLLFSLTAVPKNIKLLSFNQWVHMAPFVSKFAFDRIKSFFYSLLVGNQEKNNSPNVYSEFSINSYGDNNTHWGLEKKDFQPYEFTGDFNPKTLELISHFESICKNKGATLYLTFPSLCESAFILNTDRIKYVEKQLNATNFNILGKVADFIYKDDYFYDTPYHLNGIGVRKRSNKTLKLLKTAVK